MGYRCSYMPENSRSAELLMLPKVILEQQMIKHKINVTGYCWPSEQFYVVLCTILNPGRMKDSLATVETLQRTASCLLSLFLFLIFTFLGITSQTTFLHEVLASTVFWREINTKTMPWQHCLEDNLPHLC